MGTDVNENKPELMYISVKIRAYQLVKDILKMEDYG